LPNNPGGSVVDIHVFDAENLKSVAMHHGIAVGVSVDIMHPPIELNDEPSRMTIEVHDVSEDRHLTTESSP
jgi:hypothetical protein